MAVRKLFLSLILASILYLPASTLAHSPGQPPFLKINDKLTDVYIVSSTSLNDFDLPQDIGPENYLIGQTLSFEIDVNGLQVPPEIVNQTKFNWDFGDGGTGQGLKVTHKYQKMGSYIIKLNITPPNTLEPMLLQSTLVNVLPDKNYQLPQSKIKVNDFEAQDPLVDTLKSDFKTEFNFNGTLSDGGSSKIVEYFWDLGDQTTSSQTKTSHLFKDGVGIVFPLLRITTADGFISDSYLQISDPKLYGGVSSDPLTPENSAKFNYLIYFLIGLSVITFGLFFKPLFKKLHR